jgi:hypothetical protein
MTNPGLAHQRPLQSDPAEPPRGRRLAYRRAFDNAREDLIATDGDEVRVVDGVVAVTGLLLPVDAVLQSSMAAIGAGRGVPARPEPGALDSPACSRCSSSPMGRVLAAPR